MGATLHAFVEYDDSEVPAFSISGRHCEGLSLSNWTDLSHNKDYQFIAAISGCRRTGKPPLFQPRGAPPNPGLEVERYIEGFGETCMGWLFQDEVEETLRHDGLSHDELSIEAVVLLGILQSFANQLSSKRVRLVFDIDSP